MEQLRIGGAQLNLVVGDIEGNTQRILDSLQWGRTNGVDVMLFPELAITGYPPEDLVHRDGFVEANIAALHHIAAACTDIAAVIGFVDRTTDGLLDDSYRRGLANAAAFAAGGGVKDIYHKVLLPNFGVFDEDRYFVAGTRPGQTVEFAGRRLGISVCEDIWVPDGPPSLQAAAGAQILLNINGSPFHAGKSGERETMLRKRAISVGTPLVYLNLVGGQDELVFDGESMVFGIDGSVLHRAGRFTEEHFWVDIGAHEAHGSDAAPHQLVDDPDGIVYQALVAGLRDYVRKNGFSEVVIGLSGGIDSALTAAIAVDALGPDAVWGVTMPTRYSSPGSVADSEDLAGRLGCRFDTVAVDDVFSSYLDTLAPLFGDTDAGVAEENLQARIRGAILMALSNKYGGMVVATGNKSEMAVGYATLYGDMAGGFSVLKDVFKTQVYRMARWRNLQGEVIPVSIIEKPPSAELRPDQKDTDSLPPYDVLDGILERYIEDDESVEAIVDSGYAADIVRSITTMVDRNEYKRRQAAPGVKITTKAFGRDRRLPITNRYRP